VLNFDRPQFGGTLGNSLHKPVAVPGKLALRYTPQFRVETRGMRHRRKSKCQVVKNVGIKQMEIQNSTLSYAKQKNAHRKNKRGKGLKLALFVSGTQCISIVKYVCHADLNTDDVPQESGV